MLTDKNLVKSGPHPGGLSGGQRIYDFGHGHGLSLVNAPILHHFPFAWEAIVLKHLRRKGLDLRRKGLDWEFDFDYSTPLTKDVEVFKTDDEANNFIERARIYFQGKK